VSLAARGSRQLGEQEEKITDLAELAQVRRQANRVQLKSALVGLILTLLALVI
jgi:hypothetical protein